MTGHRISSIIAITESALTAMISEAARSLDGLETGGILLGTDTAEGLVIRHVGDPGPRAQRGTCTFLRDLDHAQRLAQWAWEEDGSQWIGEWHTHPNGGLTPSDVDFRSYLRHLHDPELIFDRFLAAIVGLDEGGGVVVATWIIEQDQARQVTLIQQPDRSSLESATPITTRSDEISESEEVS